MEQMPVICWSVVIWHLPLSFSAPQHANAALHGAAASSFGDARLFWQFCFLFFFSPNTCHFRTTRRDPPRLLRAADLSDHQSFNRLATNTTNIIEAHSPLYHPSTPLNFFLCAIYDIHPCGWLASQNSSIFPEKQLHDAVVSVMFWAVTD